ncbi:hypothetical protein CWI75_00695 [Kineobactrum sediminis]|uniref:OmpA-like domain-containing protein n=1 Tax=Kineobactrum sediminis TaxID=1905677 RepID=A0A2N5Y6A2_9GAMM|nr:OmpA family protein [Kineobactrum sediminis]PLW83912.1 hypothetical protein CWI75_00695 [Kineobactrum sediminis]
MMRFQFVSCLFACSLATFPLAHAAPEGSSGKAYPDGHGGEVFFPLGETSFADEVVSYTPGKPDGGEASSDPSVSLGIPDYVKNEDESYLTLGCGGELVVRFDDNKLIDVAGPDLYAFEVGPDVEATAMAVSENGEDWVRVGRISGGKAEVDIASYVSADDAFRFVKLVDLRQVCSTRTPGADIDAIGAMGSAAKIALDSAVLFDSGEYQLKQGGFEALDQVIAQIDEPRSSRLEVAGHTDSVGNAESNRDLSKNRARAVADYLKVNADFSEGAVTTRAYGENQPVASNDTEKGRSRNRRVELTVRMTPQVDGPGEPLVEILGIWHSRSNGIIELQRQGDQVTGHYTSSDGTLAGEFVEKDVFEGVWIKDNSRKACATQKQDSEHWGGMRLEFDSAQLDVFTGYWRYCDEEKDRGSWSEARRLL